MGPHDHKFAWKVPNLATDGQHGDWDFCSCGAVRFGTTWRPLDTAWNVSKGPFRKWMLRFLQHHNEVVRTVPENLQRHLINWAMNTTVNGIPEDDFDMWVQQYWGGFGRPKTGKPGEVLEYNADGTARWVVVAPLTKESAVNFLIHTQRIKAGWVGQILDGNLAGDVLWESEPFEDQVDDDHNLVKEGLELATTAAQEKLTEVKKALFA